MISQILFLLFFLLKQFYLFPSGGIGIADFCLMASFIVLVGKDLVYYHRIGWKREDILLYLFLLCVIVINGLYEFIYHNGEYIKYSVFWIYNGCAIWTFRKLSEMDKTDEFFKRLNDIAKLNILIQCFVLVSGWGRIFVEPWGALRYMGTFNDPNQLAFYMFMMLLLLYLYSCRFGDKTFPVFYVLAGIVILQSKSTGIFLGMLVFTSMVCVFGLVRLYKSGRYSRRIWFISGACFLTLGIILVVMIWPAPDFDVRTVEYNMLTRVQEKIWKVANGGLWGMILDRGMEKILLYPQFVLYGAGEGGFARFTLASQVNEIHCCLLSVIFCYGILPTVFLLLWLGKNLQKNTGWMWCAIVGLLAESFFLINYRQPMFWMVLLYACVTENRETVSYQN